MQRLILIFLIALSCSVFAKGGNNGGGNSGGSSGADEEILTQVEEINTKLDSLVPFCNALIDKQTELLSQIEKQIFLLQTLCISTSFLWGIALMQMIIHAKNQKSLL